MIASFGPTSQVEVGCPTTVQVNHVGCRVLAVNRRLGYVGTSPTAEHLSPQQGAVCVAGHADAHHLGFTVEQVLPVTG